MVSFVSGSDNVAVGHDALNGGASASGIRNTGVGRLALTSITSGSGNIAVGYNSLSSITTGTGNIGVGHAAGSTITTESNNIYIGSSSGVASDVNVIKIGNLFATNSGTTTIGGIHGKTSTSGIAVLVNASGVLGTTTSSIRYKQDIEDISTDFTSKIYNLRVVDFYYKAEPNAEFKSTGLIAEEVNDIYPHLMAYDEKNEIHSVKYQDIPILLLKELQIKNAEIQVLKSDMEEAKNNIATLISQMAIIQASMTPS